ncbi:hypothetical protein AUJ13_01135 [Candidatus Micrarchaeota archaeon CG1_02_49_24]|nr:MAG: hypothetical protein AUJ13_01135 [Candidatus Micrarchaeota archaeon CG1_02_49_24]
MPAQAQTQAPTDKRITDAIAEILRQHGAQFDQKEPLKGVEKICCVGAKASGGTITGMFAIKTVGAPENPAGNYYTIDMRRGKTPEIRETDASVFEANSRGARVIELHNATAAGTAQTSALSGAEPRSSDFFRPTGDQPSQIQIAGAFADWLHGRAIILAKKPLKRMNDNKYVRNLLRNLGLDGYVKQFSPDLFLEAVRRIGGTFSFGKPNPDKETIGDDLIRVFDGQELSVQAIPGPCEIYAAAAFLKGMLRDAVPVGTIVKTMNDKYRSGEQGRIANPPGISAAGSVEAINGILKQYHSPYHASVLPIDFDSMLAAMDSGSGRTNPVIAEIKTSDNIYHVCTVVGYDKKTQNLTIAGWVDKDGTRINQNLTSVSKNIFLRHWRNNTVFLVPGEDTREKLLGLNKKKFGLSIPQVNRFVSGLGKYIGESDDYYDKDSTLQLYIAAMKNIKAGDLNFEELALYYHKELGVMPGIDASFSKEINIGRGYKPRITVKWSRKPADSLLDRVKQANLSQSNWAEAFGNRPDSEFVLTDPNERKNIERLISGLHESINDLNKQIETLKKLPPGQHVTDSQITAAGYQTLAQYGSDITYARIELAKLEGVPDNQLVVKPDTDGSPFVVELDNLKKELEIYATTPYTGNVPVQILNDKRNYNSAVSLLHTMRENPNMLGGVEPNPKSGMPFMIVDGKRVLAFRENIKNALAGRTTKGENGELSGGKTVLRLDDRDPVVGRMSSMLMKLAEIGEVQVNLGTLGIASGNYIKASNELTLLSQWLTGWTSEKAVDEIIINTGSGVIILGPEKIGDAVRNIDTLNSRNPVFNYSSTTGNEQKVSIYLFTGSDMVSNQLGDTLNGALGILEQERSAFLQSTVKREELQKRINELEEQQKNNFIPASEARKEWNGQITYDDYMIKDFKTLRVGDLIGRLETRRGARESYLATNETQLNETVGDRKKEYYQYIAETRIGRFVTERGASIIVPIEGGNVSFTASAYSNQPTNCRLSFARNNRTFSAYRAGTGYGAAMDFGSWGISYSQPDFGPAAFDAYYSSGRFTISGSKTTLDGRADAEAMASYGWKF